MKQVPFERIDQIKNALTDDALPGLVAAFSKQFSDDLLLVYVRQPKGARPSGHMAITLDQLPAANLAEYDGPVLGLAAVDLIRWDIPTKGPQFCRLDRVFRGRGMVGELRDTWTDLANHVRHRLADLARDRPDDDAYRQRALAEIAAISAPKRLANLPASIREGMVAFVPDRPDLVIRLSDVFPDGLADGVLRPDDQVIALEEIRPLIERCRPALAAGYPIELRTIMRRSHLDEEFESTLTALAAAFHRRWESTSDREDLRRAYALALEVHLAKGDVDDLCAVLPDRDFDVFLHSGAGRYVYRGPLEGDDTASGSGVRRLSLDEASEKLASTGSPVTFSLLPLRGLLTAGGGAEGWSDLGPVLRKVGRTEILARNAWLLVLDFLDARQRREAFDVSAESLLETMTHCCAIYSLTDPWRARQARRNEWLIEAYEALHRLLEMLVQTSEGRLRAYYTALDHWFGCARKDRDVAESLAAMVKVLDERPSDGHRHEDQVVSVAERAEFLSGLGKALLTMLRGGGRAEAYEDLIRPTAESVPQVVSRAADMAQQMELLSVPFWGSFLHYATIGDTIRKTRAYPIPVRDKIERLGSYADQLEQGRRLIFAPYHQARILDRLYELAIEETSDSIAELQGGAALEVELRTRSIVPDSEGGIVFAVTNVGSVTARDVEVELFVSDSFELLDTSFKQALPRLGPATEHQFRFSVRANADREMFPVRCAVACARGAERQERQFASTVRVVGLDSGPFHQKPNPYVFGLPLQEHRHFYGRRGELQKLLSHLADRRPQNVLVRGARRTGKTSLLYMVQAVLADCDGRSGVRKWFDISQAWYPAFDATRPILLDLQSIDWPKGVPTATDFYKTVLGALRDAGLRQDESDQLCAEPSVTGTQFTWALRTVLRNAGGVRPVFLVDEFDILDQIAEKSEFYGRLRHAISSVQGVTWVVASALGLYNEVRDYESPLFNVFKIVKMDLLDAEAARLLIRSPWDRIPQRSRLPFADDAVEAIIEEAGRYPYFIQLLCSEVVDHVNATRTGYVQFKTVLQVIERQMVTPGNAASDYFAYLWDRAGGVGKLILLSLLRHPGAMDHAELQAAVRHHIASAGLSSIVDPMTGYDDSLQRLMVVDAIREVPGSGYVFGIPLFRRLLLKRNERESLEIAVNQALAQEYGLEVRIG